MTVVFSITTADVIVMTVDSAITRYFEDDSCEYDTGRKSYLLSGVGCVTRWGTLDHNEIKGFLCKQRISPESHSIEDVALLVTQYLITEYRPDELDLDDLGYHVAGFDRKGRPRLFHVFWGFDRPRRQEQVHRRYGMNDHSPRSGEITFLYNGRNDLAEVVVHALLDQMRSGNPTRFDLQAPEEVARFGDFVARFAAELTPQVGPPFLTRVISPRNEAATIKNDSLCPVTRDEVRDKLKLLPNLSRQTHDQQTQSP